MDIKQIIKHWIAWFKAHERLVLLLAIGFFGVHFYGKGIDYLTKRDQTQAEVAKTVAQNAAQRATDDRQSNQQTAAQLAQLQNTFNSLSLQVAQSMQQRAARTAADKQSNDAAGSAELAAILGKSVGVGTIKVEPSTSALPDTLQFSLDAAHKVADDEADLTQVKGDVKDLDTKLVACQTVADKQADTIKGLNKTITDDATALKTEQTSHADDVKTLNQEKRGAYLKGAKIGGVIAVIVVEAFRIFVAHKP